MVVRQRQYRAGKVEGSASPVRQGHITRMMSGCCESIRLLLAGSPHVIAFELRLYGYRLGQGSASPGLT